jgi:hypothetical protein
MLNVYFDIIKINGQQTYGNLIVSPTNPVTSYSGSIVGQESVEIQENGQGVTLTLVPAPYTARLAGYNADTQFLFDLTNVPDYTSVTASNYIVSDVPCPPYTASYALNAATASYVSGMAVYPDITDKGGSVGISQPNPSPLVALDVNGRIGNSAGDLIIQAGYDNEAGTPKDLYLNADCGPNKVSIGDAGPVYLGGGGTFVDGSTGNLTISQDGSLLMYDNGLNRFVTITCNNGILSVL